MANEQYDKIEAYLNQEMRPEEKKAFELELEGDSELRLEVRRHLTINKAIKFYGKHKVQTMLEGVIQELGPLPKPKIRFFDRIRFFFYSKINRVVFNGFIVLIVFLCAWLVFEVYFCPLSKISSSYYISPKLYTQAGAENQAISVLQKSRMLYVDNQVDSLIRLSKEAKDFSVPLFFLAHLNLKNGDYQMAETSFKELLKHRKNLQEYPDLQDMGSIKFNLLLSKFGNHKNWLLALSELNALMADPDYAGANLNVKTVQLKKDLDNSFLRILCIN